MSNTPYKHRPAAPEYAERGAALMAQWAEEDKANDLRETVDAVDEMIGKVTA